MNILTFIIFVPMLFSLLCFAFNKWASYVALAIGTLLTLLAIYIFTAGVITSDFLTLTAYPFNAGIYLMSMVIGFLVLLYSIKFMENKPRLGEYYGYILITLGAAAGALFANNYLILLVFWGILAITLYLLMGIEGAEAAAASKKTFIMVGAADALMIIGIGAILMLNQNLQISGNALPLNNSLAVLAFLCLGVGALTKAGAIPFHSWIPDSSLYAPVPAMALLPAALDKLLGIYLFARLCLELFKLEPSSILSIILLSLGSLTIIVGVMAALVQHNLKKLLSFHAVSQVGYMIIGIGSGIPVAMAGGIFHMFNNVIYKPLLFLAGGAIEKQTGTTELNHLGGLSRTMPITFGVALVAALSISGVPPLNGFVSKWMIYQGLIGLSQTSPLWIIWLLAAMFGSALTLASFIKFIHATFLGQGSAETENAKEVSWQMWMPMVVLAFLCVLFGLFAYGLPLNYLVLPVISGLNYEGFWNPLLATCLMLVALVIGFLIYYLRNQADPPVTKAIYVGGENFEDKTIKVSGIDFYNNVREMGPLPSLYQMAEKREFDVYVQTKRWSLRLSNLLSWMHNGLLHTYLAWLFLGMIILFFILR